MTEDTQLDLVSLKCTKAVTLQCRLDFSYKAHFFRWGLGLGLLPCNLDGACVEQISDPTLSNC